MQLIRKKRFVSLIGGSTGCIDFVGSDGKSHKNCVVCFGQIFKAVNNVAVQIAELCSVFLLIYFQKL